VELRRRRSRLGAVVTLAYSFLMLATVAYVGYRFLYAPRNSELLGVYLIVLTLPWSLLLGQLVGSSGGWVAWACIGAGFLVNAALVFWIGTGIERLIARMTRHRKRQGDLGGVQS
jgi:hypothetical protein